MPIRKNRPNYPELMEQPRTGQAITLQPSWFSVGLGRCSDLVDQRA